MIELIVYLSTRPSPSNKRDSAPKTRARILRSMVYSTGLFALLLSPASNAYEDIMDYLRQTQFHGNLRAYFFERAYTNPSTVDQNAFSLGGYVGLLTAPLYGFQAGLTLGAANSLGLNPQSSKRVDATLPADTLYVLTEGFIQYKHKYFLVRGPDQILDTPWISPSDSRMTPSSYRGVYVKLTPFADHDLLKNLSFIGLTLTDFNGRTEGYYSPTNLYFPGHAGGSPVAGLAGKTAPGATAFALKYEAKGKPFAAQVWFNQFYDFSQLFWLDASYNYKTGTGYDPLFGVQFANQWSDGNNLLQQVGQGIAANTQAYGVLAGVDMPFVRLTAAYNGIVKQTGTFFANGDLLSPYSTGYATDPLYTTQMIGGMIEKQSPGSAFKVAATSFFLDKQVKAVLSFARYYITPTKSYASEPAETDVDITYSFSKSSRLDGLSIRNRLGMMTGNIADGHFFYERFQIQYQF